MLRLRFFGSPPWRKTLECVRKFSGGELWTSNALGRSEWKIDKWFCFVHFRKWLWWFVVLSGKCYCFPSVDGSMTFYVPLERDMKRNRRRYFVFVGFGVLMVKYCSILSLFFLSFVNIEFFLPFYKKWRLHPAVWNFLLENALQSKAPSYEFKCLIWRYSLVTNKEYLSTVWLISW